MPDPILSALLQAAGNVTTSVTQQLQGRPPWLTVAEVIVLLAGAVVVGTILTRLVRTVMEKAGASKGVANTVTQWVTVLMIIGVVIGAAYLTGLSSELTTLTLSGIAGLAASLALQNTLSNIIAGVLLINDGVLRLGDDIQYGGPGGVRGEVVKLSLRTTWVRTPQGVIAVIGNSNLSSGPILNYSAKERLEKKLRV